MITIKPLFASTIITISIAAYSISLAQNKLKKEKRAIELPDIPGYKTLKCDLHTHSVFSDGYVWPTIRVQEAIKDGIDVLAITEHVEFQPFSKDIPHPDRNRSYQVALKETQGKDLIVINGAEITRDMPPGHSNAIFLKDVNKLNVKDPIDAFREAKKQGAYVFWNHPNWIAQQKDGMAKLTDMHKKLIKENILQGIEIVNEFTYSEEAFQIALDNNLAIVGNSDIHGLVDWEYNVYKGGHRPVTLVFAKDNTVESLKEALFARRTAVWHKNSLFGAAEYLVPLVKASFVIKETKTVTDWSGISKVQSVKIYNQSDVNYILENISEYTLHTDARVLTIEAHKITELQVKTLGKKAPYNLKFKVLNAYEAPKKNIEVVIEVNQVK